MEARGEDKGVERQSAKAPVIILTASRSGSTLLRFVIDSHPDFACPPEAGIGPACASLERVWSVLSSIEAPPSGEGPLLRAEQYPETVATVRGVIDGLYSAYAERRGKSRWCDKSLDNVMFAPLIAEVFPDAKFICLYRHCMDVIASGVEISQWGLRGFGYAEYAIQHPGNSVAAIGSYWANCAHGTLEFEKANPEKCIRIRYEDFASDPELVAQRLFSFLGARHMPGITETCFQAEHDRLGPGDQKIWFTQNVSKNSIGRGVVVPANALPPPLRERINDALSKLGYKTVEDDWNKSVGFFEPRADVIPSFGEPHPEAIAERDKIIEEVAVRIASSGFPESWLHERWPSLAGKHIHIVVEAPGCLPAELAWEFGSRYAEVIPADQPGMQADSQVASSPEFTEGSSGTEADEDPESCAMIAADCAAWSSLLTGATNLAVETVAGRIRSASPSEPGVIAPREVMALAEVLDLAVAWARPA